MIVQVHHDNLSSRQTVRGYHDIVERTLGRKSRNTRSCPDLYALTSGEVIEYFCPADCSMKAFQKRKKISIDIRKVLPLSNWLFYPQSSHTRFYDYVRLQFTFSSLPLLFVVLSDIKSHPFSPSEAFQR